jgi:hypothetical protein
VIKEEFDEQKRYRENIIDRIEYKEYYKAIYNAHYHIDEIVVGIVFFKSKKFFYKMALVNCSRMNYLLTVKNA